MQAERNDIILFVIIITILLLFMLSFIAAVLFLYQKKNILYYKQLEDVKTSYEKSLLQTELEIQEQTFQNISREIHDNIGLSLTLAKLHLNTIDYQLENNTREIIHASIDLIGKAIQDLSDVSKSLNSEAIKAHGLYNTLKVETDKINRSGRLIVEFTEEGDIVFLDSNKELILYRIAQEALNNILKHAQASRVSIKLIYESDRMRLCIEDNGKGFDKLAVEKYRSGKIPTGLSNIRTRTKTLDGECSINSSPGNGTTIIVSAPY